MKMKAYIRKNPNEIKFNADLYRQKLSEKLPIASNDIISLETLVEKTTKVILECNKQAKSHISIQVQSKLSADTQKLMEERRKTKKEGAEYRSINNRVRKSIRKD